MSLMEIFSNPDTISTLSFGEKMLASFITMCIGLGITFLVLIIIWIFISLMGKAMDLGKKEIPQKTVESNEADEAGGESVNKAEIAAVIAAAIAAYNEEMGCKGENKLVVKRIKRISGNNAPWVLNR